MMVNVSIDATEFKPFVESIPTSSLPLEEILQHLDRYNIDWYLSDGGDLFIRYWQLGAGNVVPPARVAQIRAGKPPPPEADKLEWVSKQLGALRAEYAGKWIGVTDQGVAAAADDLADLMTQLGELGVVEPFVTQIPEEMPTWHTAYAG